MKQAPLADALCVHCVVRVPRRCTLKERMLHLQLPQGGRGQHPGNMMSEHPAGSNTQGVTREAIVTLLLPWLAVRGDFGHAACRHALSLPCSMLTGTTRTPCCKLEQVSTILTAASNPEHHFYCRQVPQPNQHALCACWQHCCCNSSSCW